MHSKTSEMRHTSPGNLQSLQGTKSLLIKKKNPSNKIAKQA